MSQTPSDPTVTVSHTHLPRSKVTRRVYRLLRPVLVACGLVLILGYSALELTGGGPVAMAADPQGDTPAVVELFTSQGCYSCPPAEALLGELIENSDKAHLVALEFHVDYWDKLVYGRHGSHKDPFSSVDNTLRQQVYNQDLQGQRGVYTPQMVVNGRYGAVGSKRRTVNDSIRLVDRPAFVLNVSESPQTAVSSDGDKALRIDMATRGQAVPETAHVWLAVFDVEETTVITTGENHDKTLTSHHIVREFEQVSPRGGIADLVGSDGNLQLDVSVSLGEGQGCAVLVQGFGLGPIHGAAYCPDSVWTPPSS